MGWRFLFDRAVAGTLALGFAVPLNLPYAVQASQIADSANVDTPVRPVAAGGSAQSGGVEQPGSANPHREARLLRIGAQGELPCDSGEWATSGLFGPHAALAEALGVDPAGIPDLLADFNAWLTESGHQTWTRETFGPRFADHAETRRHGVEHKRLRNPAGLYRLTSAWKVAGTGTGWAGPATGSGQVRVWRGVRPRLPSDETEP